MSCSVRTKARMVRFINLSDNVRIDLPCEGIFIDHSVAQLERRDTPREVLRSVVIYSVIHINMRNY